VSWTGICCRCLVCQQPTTNACLVRRLLVPQIKRAAWSRNQAYRTCEIVQCMSWANSSALHPLCMSCSIVLINEQAPAVGDQEEHQQWM
jgi:hypothetical protein